MRKDNLSLDSPVSNRMHIYYPFTVKNSFYSIFRLLGALKVEILDRFLEAAKTCKMRLVKLKVINKSKNYCKIIENLPFFNIVYEIEVIFCNFRNPYGIREL